jgi:hypothetical protein
MKTLEEECGSAHKETYRDCRNRVSITLVLQTLWLLNMNERATGGNGIEKIRKIYKYINQ